MMVEAFFCEWEEKHEVNGEIDGEPHGCEEMPPGELQIFANMYEDLTPKLERIGYIVCSRAVDDSWMRRWENGIEFDDRHWHPEARLVFF